MQRLQALEAAAEWALLWTTAGRKKTGERRTEKTEREAERERPKTDDEVQMIRESLEEEKKSEHRTENKPELFKRENQEATALSECLLSRISILLLLLLLPPPLHSLLLLLRSSAFPGEDFLVSLMPVVYFCYLA